MRHKLVTFGIALDFFLERLVIHESFSETLACPWFIVTSICITAFFIAAGRPRTQSS